MKPPIEFRPKKPSVRGIKALPRPSKPEKTGSSPAARSTSEDAAAVLARKRELKAAQMRRWRARRSKGEIG